MKILVILFVAAMIISVVFDIPMPKIRKKNYKMVHNIRYLDIR